MQIRKSHNKSSRMVSHGLIYLALGLLAITILVPLLWVFMASLKENSEFYGNPWLLPKGLYVQNFADAWSKAHMGSFMLNSALTTAMALLMLLVFALPAAYVLSRFRFRLRRLLNVSFMGGLFINVNYIVVPIFLMLVAGDKQLRGWGMNAFFLNNLFVLALVYASTALPFTIYLLSGYFATLPAAYEEAAYIDGATYFTTMVRVMFPLALPAIITVILFNFLSFWNEYIISMTLLSSAKGPKTLPVGLMYLTKAQNARSEFGQLYAGLVLVMLPTLILYMLVQRKLTQGMALGGLKG